MQVRFISDLHFGVNREWPGEVPFDLEEMDNEHEQILILAGDVCDSSVTGIQFVENMCTRFKYVLYVFGNHEYYKQSIDGAKQVFLNQFDQVPENLHILDSDTFELDDVVFIGTTLWTDLDNNSPTTSITVSRFLNDCRLIRINEGGTLKFRGETWYNLHCAQRDYIDEQCTKFAKSGKKIVVITHHAPSLKSVHEIFAGSDINGGFASDLDWLIKKHNIQYWIHGHMHHVFQYDLHDTRVMCNPRGYRQENLQGPDGNFFDHKALIEI